MTTEAQSRQFEFKQAIIELLWNDDTPQAAAGVVARCTSHEEREHALWMAVALQRAAAVTALLQAGISAQAREAALSLLCGGLARAGAPKADTHVAEWGAWSVNTIDIPVKVGTSPFWFEAEKLMDIYLEQGRIKGDWLVMLPALSRSQCRAKVRDRSRVSRPGQSTAAKGRRAPGSSGGRAPP